jgi:membrane-associated protease RseP (regulator of RpoE activity)
MAGLVTVASGPAPAGRPLSSKATVPFEMLATNHMVVRAKINGKGPFDLIFDVGAPITLLANKAALDAGVIKPDAPRSFLFSIRGESEVKTLEVGDLKSDDLPVIVLDHPLLKAMGEMLDRRLDGIIGYTFFARYRTTIDYQARTMTFEPVNTRVRNLMKDLPDRLAGPRVARHRVLAPGGLFGLEVGDPADGLSSPGIPIVSVLADSPAAAAGLKPGDILTTLDGRWTTNALDAYAAAASTSPGQDVAVVVLRDGKELTLTVRPAEGI